jgi:hypothetical protein
LGGCGIGLNAADAGKRNIWHRGLINRWIEETPVGKGNGWEPYPSSLRIVNRAKWGMVPYVLKEECCVLETPCLTLRWNTERPVTLREHGGASVLVGNNVTRMGEEYEKTLGNPRRSKCPELWDGRTAERRVEAIVAFK